MGQSRAAQGSGVGARRVWKALPAALSPQSHPARELVVHAASLFGDLQAFMRQALDQAEATQALWHTLSSRLRVRGAPGQSGQAPCRRLLVASPSGSKWWPTRWPVGPSVGHVHLWAECLLGRPRAGSGRGWPTGLTLSPGMHPRDCTPMSLPTGARTPCRGAFPVPGLGPRTETREDRWG